MRSLKKREWERLHPDKMKEMRRRDYAKHSAAYKARAMARYHKVKSNPQFKKKMADNLKKWRKRNWQHYLLNAREYQKKDRKKKPEHYRAKAARKHQRVKSDPARWMAWLASSQRRRARKRHAKGSHTVQQWLARIAFYGWRCAYCKILLTMRTLTKDHIIPLSRNGTDWASNLAPACKSCNSRKKDC